MRSHALLGFLIATALGIHSVTARSTKPQCMPKDLLDVQIECQQVNERFLDAKHNHDTPKLCTELFLLWKCVASEVSKCFNKFTEAYESYFHSPHNCELTSEQVLELQNIKNTIDVDVVPLTSSSAQPVTSVTTEVTSQNSSSEGSPPMETGKGGKESGHKGGTDGNGSPLTNSNSVVMATALLITMTVNLWMRRGVS